MIDINALTKKHRENTDQRFVVCSNVHLLTSRSKDLIHHVPVESIEHALAMRVLITKRWPKLRPDAVVKWPSVLPYDQLRLSLPTGLQQRMYLSESLQRLLFAGG